jgi:hypothetical protein
MKPDIADIFKDVVLDKPRHTYSVNGIKVSGVSSFMRNFQAPFDRDGNAERVALKTGKTVEAIKAEWDASHAIALAKGEAVHLAIAAILNPPPEPVEVTELAVDTDDPFIIESEPPKVPLFHTVEVRAFVKAWEKIGNGREVAAVEVPIANTAINLGGTPDIVLYDPSTGLCHVWDVKTGKNFKTTNDYGNRMLDPLKFYHDCEYIRYSLQVSAYSYILGQAGLKMGANYILYLDPLGKYQSYRAEDFTETIPELVEYVKKKRAESKAQKETPA